MKIIGTQSDRYQAWRSRQGMARNNGAYWYAKEIEDIILPELKHLNLWINTVGANLYNASEVPNGAVIVCHDNVNTIRTYRGLFKLDVLWICSKQSVVDMFTGHGEKAVYIPLSIDTEYVKQFKRKRRTKDTAFVGNAWSYKQKYLSSLPDNIDQLYGMEREDLLREMAKYRNVIAEGRCLIEAKVLGAKTELPTHGYGDTIDREVIDSREAIPMWREVLEAHQQSLGYCILEAVKSFRDLQAHRNRRLGEIFTATPDRAEELLSNKLRLVEKI